MTHGQRPQRAFDLDSAAVDRQPVEGEAAAFAAGHAQRIGSACLEVGQTDRRLRPLSRAQLQSLARLQLDPDRKHIGAAVGYLDHRVPRPITLGRLVLVLVLLEQRRRRPGFQRFAQLSDAGHPDHPGARLLSERPLIFAAANLRGETAMIGDLDLALGRLARREGDAPALRVDRDMTHRRKIGPILEVGDDDLIGRDRSGIPGPLLRPVGRPDGQAADHCLAVHLVEPVINGRRMGDACTAEARLGQRTPGDPFGHVGRWGLPGSGRAKSGLSFPSRLR